MDLNAVRAAENESRFREANERIERAADEHAFSGLVPFICECSDQQCTEIMRVTLAAYHDVHTHPARFIVAPGHEEDESSRCISRNDGYDVVEKTGDAASVAEALAEGDRPG